MKIEAFLVENVSVSSCQVAEINVGHRLRRSTAASMDSDSSEFLYGGSLGAGCGVMMWISDDLRRYRLYIGYI